MAPSGAEPAAECQFPVKEDQSSASSPGKQREAPEAGHEPSLLRQSDYAATADGTVAGGSAVATCPELRLSRPGTLSLSSASP